MCRPEDKVPRGKKGLLTEEQKLLDELELALPGASRVRASEHPLLASPGQVRKASSGSLCPLEFLRLLRWALLMPVSELPFQELYPLPTVTKQHKYFAIKIEK